MADVERERSHRSESDLLWKLRWHEKKSFLIYERNFISWQEQQESWKLCGKVWVVHFGSVDIDRVCMIGTEAHKISARLSITIMRYRISVWRNQIKVRRKFPPLSLNSSGWRELRQPHNRLYPVKVNRVFIFVLIFMCFSLTFNFRLRASLPPLLFRARNIQIYSNSLIPGTIFQLRRIVRVLWNFYVREEKRGNFLSLRATRNKIFHASLRIKMKRKGVKGGEKRA